MPTPAIRKPLMNEQIRGKEVRLLDQTGQFIGIVARDLALQKAKELGIDLVLITAGNPPVCRLIEVGKYLYEISKKHKHAPVHKEKELSLSVNIAQHDFDTRVRHAQEFLEKGHTVRVILAFTGRESAHAELGFDVVNRFISSQGAHVKATPVKRAGNKLFVSLHASHK